MTKLSKYRINSKPIAITCLVVILIIATQSLNMGELLNTLFIWVESLGVLAPIFFIVIYNLATVLLIPGSLLTLKGGCLFGVVWGSVYVFIAATLGAISAFLIGRYLSRDWVYRKMESSPQFKAINEAVKKEGIKIVLLTRLSPIFPFNLLNYAFGVTQVSLRDYLLGSLGMIPATVMYVYMGSLATDLATLNISSQPTTKEIQLAQWMIRIVGLMATVVVTLYVTHLAKKSLNGSVITEESSDAKSRTL